MIHRFDSPNIQQNSSLGSLILWWHGFGVVNIMGTNSREALVGDLAIKINHTRFDRQTQVWIKIHDGTREWNNVRQTNASFFHFLHSLVLMFQGLRKKVRSPRLGIFRYPRPTFLQIALSKFSY
jgi:hypothetical protein